MQTDINVLSRIRIHGPSVRASKDSRAASSSGKGNSFVDLFNDVVNIWVHGRMISKWIIGNNMEERCYNLTEVVRAFVWAVLGRTRKKIRIASSPVEIPFWFRNSVEYAEE
jgi:hypothetical protein